jgi:DNA polymerase-1
MVIGEAPGQREDEEHRAFVGSAGQVLRSVLNQVGIDPDDCYITNVAKCRPPNNRTPENKEIKVCVENYLVKEFDRVRPDFVLLLGNSALRGVIGKSGITKYNGVVWEVEVAAGHKASIMGTVHPAAVLRNPRYKDVFAADIVRFANLTRGVSTEPETKIKLVSKKGHLKYLLEVLMEADEISWDVETATEPVEKPYVRTPGQDWLGDESYITSIAFSVEEGESYAFLLDHPDTPWASPEDVLEAVRPAMLRKDCKYVAHNGKFDARWLHSKGIPVRQDFDTMLAAHMLDENRLKGLKPLSKILLGAAPYNEEVDTKQTRSIPGRQLLRYNAKDTDYTLRLYHIFRDQLKEEPRIARVFQKLMMPASNVLVDVERYGVWVDPERWEERYLQACENRDKIDRYIQQWWPEDNSMNINSHPQVARLLFEHLGLPIIEKTNKGKPSSREGVLLQLEKQHVVCKALIKWRKWAKYVNTYLGPWKYEWMDDNGRIHSTYKLFGTVTGRISGEGGIQQVPRDPFIRSVIGAPPGWKFLQADYSQVELRVAAMLANERRMIRQFLQGEDIHMIRAMRMTGKTNPQDVAKEERKKAKPVSFGYLYGMGAKKFVTYAFENYGVDYTLEEAQENREQFFSDYPALRPWHDRQRRLARKYGRVNSPIGRVRHLPDIESAEESVRQEAERQAINSPVQSFASDLMLLSLITLHREVLDPRECRIVGTVHDSILFEVREDVAEDYAGVIKETMEDMSLVRRKFGTEVTVPIVADIEIGQHWGEGTPWEPTQ